MKDVQMYKRGQIYWKVAHNVDAPGILSKTRPVLLVSNDLALSSGSIATVVPLSTQTQSQKCYDEVTLNMNDVCNYVLVEQIYTCSIKDLHGYIGTCSDEIMAKVDIAILQHLGMVSLSKNATEDLVDLTESDLSEREIEACECVPNAEEASQSSNRTQWNDSTMLELCVDYDSYRDGQLSASELLSRYNFSTIGSLASSANRFKKKLGV